MPCVLGLRSFIWFLSESLTRDIMSVPVLKQFLFLLEKKGHMTHRDPRVRRCPTLIYSMRTQDKTNLVMLLAVAIFASILNRKAIQFTPSYCIDTKNIHFITEMTVNIVFLSE